MNNQYDLDAICAKYRHYYEEALRNGRKHLPYYEVQPWNDLLNKIELRIFEDVREFGVGMYPIFPVADNTYLHFANPFLRIGIEIAYKNSTPRIITRKLELLKAQGWTIYLIPSQHCYYTLEEFFHIKRKDPNKEWNDLSPEHQSNFFQKYHLENSACLLNYIKQRHFGMQLA